MTSATIARRRTPLTREPDPRLLGGLGRLGARRHGLVHLLAGARAGVDRTAAALGHRATPANVGFYGSVLFALFLIGWGLSMIWGPIADRFGRVRTLTLTISATRCSRFSAAWSTSIWQLAALPFPRGRRHRRRMVDGRDVRRRRVAGGSPQGRRRLHAHRLLLRVLPRRDGQLFRRREVRLAVDVRRRRHAGAAGRLHPLRRPRVGGWRRRERRAASSADDARRSRRSSRRPYARRTMLNSLYLLVSIVGLWAGSVYVPTSVRRSRCATAVTRGRRGAAGLVRHDGAVGGNDPRLPRRCRRSPSASAGALTLGAVFCW